MVVFPFSAEAVKPVTEKNPLFAKERALSATETIDLAKSNGLAIYAPHPSFTFTGGAKVN